MTGRHGARHGAPTEREDLALELSPAGEGTAMDSLRVVTEIHSQGALQSQGKLPLSPIQRVPGSREEQPISGSSKF